MSELHPIWEDFFTGRKPSRAQVMAKIKAAIQAGAKSIEIAWGENAISLIYDDRRLSTGWSGHGWIKDIGGDDLAKDLNQAAREHRRTLDLWNS